MHAGHTWERERRSTRPIAELFRIDPEDRTFQERKRLGPRESTVLDRAQETLTPWGNPCELNARKYRFDYQTRMEGKSTIKAVSRIVYGQTARDALRIAVSELNRCYVWDGNKVRTEFGRWYRVAWERYSTERIPADTPSGYRYIEHRAPEKTQPKVLGIRLVGLVEEFKHMEPDNARA